MEKLLELDANFPKTGEPTVSLVAWGNGRGGLTLEKRAFAESHSPLYDFLKNVQPEVGCSFILVNALGAYEYYDDNRNGDGFPARPFKVSELATCGHPECSKSLEGWISEEEVLTQHFKSFEKHGNIYRNHKNSDPATSLGYIQKAIWNPRMHRVELLLKVVNERCPDLAERIGNGDFPAVSMGCHVRWDVCTICGHRAPTRAQYCEHALRSLRQVLPDGRKVSVLNPSPKFFDISFVFRPADPTGWMLKKVADVGHGHSSAELGERVAAYRGRAIELQSSRLKVASELASSYGPVAADVVSEWPSIEGAPLEALAKLGSLSDALSTLASVGVVLSGTEVTQLMAKKAGLRYSASDLDRLAALQPALDEVLSQYPTARDKLAGLVEFRLDGVKLDKLESIASWVEKRGGYADYVRSRAYAPSDTFQLPVGPGASYRAYQPPRTELLTMTDPNTGEQYQTTRGAAQDADHEKSHSQLAGTALLGALYAGGLRAALGRRAGMWAIPAGLAAGYATTKAIKKSFPAYRHPTYMTDQGIPVSGGTEFNKVSAFERPTRADVVHKAAFDTYSRTGSIRPDALPAKLASTAFGRWLTSTSLSEKVAAIVAGAETDALDVGAPPELDLAVVVHNVCHLVWAD